MRKFYFIFAVILVAFLGNAITTNSQVSLVVSLTGSAFDEISRMPVKVRYECYDEKGKRVAVGRTNPAQNGFYYITGLKPGQKYQLKFVDPGYLSQQFEVEIPQTDKYKEFSKDFLLTPKKSGLKIKLRVPPFELRKSKLRAGAEFFLSDITNTLKMNPKLTFEVRCYPDDPENMVENSKMTKARAQALQDYFISKGIDATRISSKGISSIDPDNPLPKEKRAKGKRYIGSIYVVVKTI